MNCNKKSKLTNVLSLLFPSQLLTTTILPKSFIQCRDALTHAGICLKDLPKIQNAKSSDPLMLWHDPNKASQFQYIAGVMNDRRGTTCLYPQRLPNYNISYHHDSVKKPHQIACLFQNVISGARASDVTSNKWLNRVWSSTVRRWLM
jgi:hypothetical protein